MTAAISARGIEKSYGDLQVLRGVDLDVDHGSVFALLGSNGAGKTTMVRILSTLLSADAGTATVHGVDVAREPRAVREAISLTGQFAAVDEILTGRENLVLVAKLRHLPDAGRIADDLLRRFRLTDAGGRRVGTCSGGLPGFSKSRAASAGSISAGEGFYPQSMRALVGSADDHGQSVRFAGRRRPLAG